jgi:hypothetical protein
MTDKPTPAKPAPDLRDERGGTLIARRERYFKLMASGPIRLRIATMARTSVAAVQREINRALAERKRDPPRRFARAQAARLVKALRLAEAAVELVELKAVAAYLRIAAALDRFHELAAGTPPPRRPTAAPPLAPPTPPKALSFDAPPANQDPSTIDEPSRAAEEIQR